MVQPTLLMFLHIQRVVSTVAKVWYHSKVEIGIYHALLGIKGCDCFWLTQLAKRLQDAGMVEIFNAQIAGSKVRPFLVLSAVHNVSRHYFRSNFAIYLLEPDYGHEWEVLHKILKSGLVLVSWNTLTPNLQWGLCLQIAPCIRLLKSFNTKAFNAGNDDTEAETQLRGVKRGQVTDQVVESVLDRQMYDLIDNSGPGGLYMMDVSYKLTALPFALHFWEFCVLFSFDVVSAVVWGNKMSFMHCSYN